MERNLDIFAKLKLILTKPSIFWDVTKNEKGLGNVMKYIWTLIPIGVAFAFIKEIIFLNQNNLPPNEITELARLSLQTGMSQATLLLIISVAFFLFFFIVSFLTLPLLHLFIKMFKGQGNIDKTYQAWMYASTPGLLFASIPFVGAFTSFWSLYLQIIGISEYHKISKSRVVLAQVLYYFLIIVLITVVLLAIVWGGFFPKQQNTEVNADIVHTSSGQAWTDAADNIQITFPIHWQVTEKIQGTQVAAFEGTTGDEARTLVLVRIEKVNPALTLKTLKQTQLASNSQIKDTTVGGEQALEVPTLSNDTFLVTSEVLKDGKIYEITESSPAADFNSVSTIFQNILQSVTFTK